MAKTLAKEIKIFRMPKSSGVYNLVMIGANTKAATWVAILLDTSFRALSPSNIF
jgi:hypothetical protein